MESSHVDHLVGEDNSYQPFQPPTEFDFDFCQHLSLAQSISSSPLLSKTPKKRGWKPKIFKIQEEIAAGIKSTIVDKFSPHSRPRRTSRVQWGSYLGMSKVWMPLTRGGRSSSSWIPPKQTSFYYKKQSFLMKPLKIFFKKWTLWDFIHVPIVGASSGILTLWNPKTIKAKTLNQGTNWHLILIENFDLSFLLFNIYGPIASHEKHALWNTLSCQIHQHGVQKIILGGDFNAILSQDDKQGGNPTASKVIDDFRSFVFDNALSDILPSNGQFAWTNRRNFQIASRLDRFFSWYEWILHKYTFSSNILSLSGSNHFPISLCLDKHEVSHHRSSFKFERIWFRHPHFHALLRQWWVNAPFCRGNKKFQFYMKMQFVKANIKFWNREVFKNIFVEKSYVEKELKDINELIFSNGINPKTFSRKKHLQSYWEELCPREEVYWRQKSREIWLKDGDKSTKLFQASAKIKQAASIIVSIEIPLFWV